MKATLKLTRRLYAIQQDLDAGFAFLMEEHTAIMQECGLTSTDVFTAPFYPGKKYTPINKEIGSVLCRLQTGIKSLEALIEELRGKRP